jgi:hypothetical protein
LGRGLTEYHSRVVIHNGDKLTSFVHIAIALQERVPGKFQRKIVSSFTQQKSKKGDQYFNGHFRILNWRYLPPSMAKNMVLTYLHFRILEISHLIFDMVESGRGTS